MMHDASKLRRRKKMCDKKKDQGSFDIKLPGAEHGKVVTRFPPEPSGYLHIGHAKAVLLNEYFARHYDGQLIVRFDDTNALKEKAEYEQSILEDLQLLGVKPDRLTYTSDYFDLLLASARQLIDAGLAYVDDTPQERMREERGKGIASSRRDLALAEVHAIFDAMVAGEDTAQAWCLRAKMSIDSPNKALRDPVMYRCQRDVPHHRTGSAFLVYPTYDFACPVVDSLEGVTHALRTSEYRDRNPQYEWFCDALAIRKPHIWDYSRLNFVYTLLSKRKLTWFVAEGRVQGWDDPRFPTIRGILRRGLTLQALRDYILMQGASKNTLLLEWDKLWSLNKKEIDPVAPRYTALPADGLVPVKLQGDLGGDEWRLVSLHPKNEAVGSKRVAFSSIVHLGAQDARDLVVDEEITLMKWGNIIVRDVSDPVDGFVAQLHPQGDFKLTKKKLTWLGGPISTYVDIQVHDYDYLITKKKLEENDSLEDFLTPVTEYISNMKGEEALKSVKKGEIIQLERSGYYICDRPWSPTEPMKLILIPDGKTKSITSKHAL